MLKKSWGIIAGKVVKPDKTSATFLSFIGNLDKRMELDKNINHGDSRYYGALSMMASKASYENKAYIKTIVNDHWKVIFVRNVFLFRIRQSVLKCLQTNAFCIYAPQMEFLDSFDFWNGENHACFCWKCHSSYVGLSMDRIG